MAEAVQQASCTAVQHVPRTAPGAAGRRPPATRGGQPHPSFRKVQSTPRGRPWERGAGEGRKGTIRRPLAAPSTPSEHRRRQGCSQTPRGQEQHATGTTPPSMTRTSPIHPPYTPQSLQAALTGPNSHGGGFQAGLRRPLHVAAPRERQPWWHHADGCTQAELPQQAAAHKARRHRMRQPSLPVSTRLTCTSCRWSQAPA